MRPTSLLFSLLLLLSSTTFAGWSSSGPTGGAMNAVVVAPSDANVVWAANSAGVYRSTDGGATWSGARGPADVLFVAVHPADADKAWAWSQSAGVYRTGDGGATWTALHALTNTLFPTAFMVDPQEPDRLYASGDCYHTLDATFVPGDGVYESTDAGATWKPIAPSTGPSLCTVEMALDPFSPWRVFATGAFASRSESYDRGQSWERPNDARPSRAVLFDPRYPYTHYGITAFAGNSGGFLVSQDGGFTWTTTNTKLPALPRALTIDPARGRLFLGTTKGVFRSGDGGRVWVGTLLPPLNVNALGFAQPSDALLAATSLGLFAVGNHGLGDAHRVDLHDIAATVVAFDADPGDGNFLYAVTDDARFYRSTNGGGSWEQLAFDGDVAIDRVSVGADGTVYASSTSQHALYRRGRADAKWTVVRSDVTPSLLAADPKHAGTLFMRSCCSIERSRDFGATWEFTSVNGSYLSFSQDEPQSIYVASSDRVYRSTDGGNRWFETVNTDTRALVAAPSNGVIVYRIRNTIGGAPQAERSEDGGYSWRALPLPGLFYPGALAVDPHDAHSVWAATDPYFFGSGLFHSTDGGAHWTAVDGPFGTPITAAAIRFDPSGKVVHFAFPQHGVWELPAD